jgi:hypothetical protein
MPPSACANALALKSVATVATAQKSRRFNMTPFAHATTKHGAQPSDLLGTAEWDQPVVNAKCARISTDDRDACPAREQLTHSASVRAVRRIATQRGQGLYLENREGQCNGWVVGHKLNMSIFQRNDNLRNLVRRNVARAWGMALWTVRQRLHDSSRSPSM